MSEQTATVPTPWLMARVEITPEEWKAVRGVALRDGIPTQRLIGDVLRAMLVERRKDA